MNARLINEHALALARRLVGVVRPALREEEVRDCFDEFFALCREEMARFAEAAERMERRLRPAEKP